MRGLTRHTQAFSAFRYAGQHRYFSLRIDTSDTNFERTNQIKPEELDPAKLHLDINKVTEKDAQKEPLVKQTL
jgi:hypothetical protein